MQETLTKEDWRVTDKQKTLDIQSKALFWSLNPVLAHLLLSQVLLCPENSET